AGPPPRSPRARRGPRAAAAPGTRRRLRPGRAHRRPAQRAEHQTTPPGSTRVASDPHPRPSAQRKGARCRLTQPALPAEPRGLLPRYGKRARRSRGGSCAGRQSGPARLSLSTADAPADLPVPLALCLTGCDGATNPTCLATAERIGPSQFPLAMPPLPQLLGGVPVCVVQQGVRVRIDLMASVATGAIEGTISRFSLLYPASDLQHICPRCVA